MEFTHFPFEKVTAGRRPAAAVVRPPVERRDVGRVARESLNTPESTTGGTGVQAQDLHDLLVETTKRISNREKAVTEDGMHQR